MHQRQQIHPLRGGVKLGLAAAEVEDDQPVGIKVETAAVFFVDCIAVERARMTLCP